MGGGSEVDNTPIIVSVSQRTHKNGPFIEPLKLLHEVVQDSISAVTSTSNSDVQQTLVARLDYLVVVASSVGSPKLPSLLSGLIGASPKHLEYTRNGGDVPQMYVNQACTALETGKYRFVVLAGAECFHSTARVLKLQAQGKGPENWPPFDTSNFELLPSMNRAYGLTQPIRFYPFIETAVRARLSNSPKDHALQMGRLFSRYAKVASENPHAWFNKPYTAEEIATPSKSNRMVVYPYTKHMIAFPEVDQGACVILTTVSQARELGISSSQWVYPMGGANFIDVEDVTERLNLDESPSIRNAALMALEQAGVTLKDVAFFDLYSCFPSAVQVGIKEIGLSENDPRPFTVTGGLPFFGGPGNNYSMHAIASVVERLRQPSHQQSTALVWANGKFLTNHAVGLYGHHPPKFPWSWQSVRLPPIQQSITAAKFPPLVTQLEGPARIEAFIIVHNRQSGNPEWGIALVRLIDSSALHPIQRSLATFDHTVEELIRLEESEQVGRIGQVKFDPKKSRNTIRLDITSSKL